MRLDELEAAVKGHSGEFLCEQMSERSRTRLVRFTHRVGAPEVGADVPAIGRLADFYETFGSIFLYYDEKSGEVAKHMAAPSQWAGLRDNLFDWIDNLSEEERQDFVPEWVKSCLVIGETPQSGNYVLVPTEGAAAGRVFEFDHDGFEFTDVAPDVVGYVQRLLEPDHSTLMKIASHMRFIEEGALVQWWILELRDNRGRVVRTGD